MVMAAPMPASSRAPSITGTEPDSPRGHIGDAEQHQPDQQHGLPSSAVAHRAQRQQERC
jgi:hypothetical protein